MAYAYNKGIRIHYQIAGSGGPPLLLHHGFSDALGGWGDSGWLDHLKQDYRLILVDARGHGASDRPHQPEAYSLAQRTADILAVLNELKLQRVHYLGFSLGGWLGFGLARFAPDRLHSLILLGAHPYAESMAFYRDMLAPGLPAWVKAVDRLGGGLPQTMKQRMLANDLVALQASVARDRPDISDVLPTTFIPTLLCVGTADPRYLPVQKCARALPRAELHTVPDFNHFQLFLRPAASLPRILPFLDKVQRDTPKLSSSTALRLSVPLLPAVRQNP